MTDFVITSGHIVGAIYGLLTILVFQIAWGETRPDPLRKRVSVTFIALSVLWTILAIVSLAAVGFYEVVL